jgi:hypothetical protein
MQVVLNQIIQKIPPPKKKCTKDCCKWNITNFEGIIWNNCEKYGTHYFSLLSKPVMRLISFMLRGILDTIWWKEDVLTHEVFLFKRKYIYILAYFSGEIVWCYSFCTNYAKILAQGVRKIKTTSHLTHFYNCFLKDKLSGKTGYVDSLNIKSSFSYVSDWNKWQGVWFQFLGYACQDSWLFDIIKCI